MVTSAYFCITAICKIAVAAKLAIMSLVQHASVGCVGGPQTWGKPSRHTNKVYTCAFGIPCLPYDANKVIILHLLLQGQRTSPSVQTNNILL